MKLNAVIISALLLTPCLGVSNATNATVGFGENTLNMLVPPTAAPSTSPAPTAPTTSPTDSPVPSPSPSDVPTGAPTSSPKPTSTVTTSPTDSPVPSPSPTAIPSDSPSASPTGAPSSVPSSAPTSTPSASPSSAPTRAPSASPSRTPSAAPSLSSRPSAAPSVSSKPSSTPSVFPSLMPSSEPSGAPSSEPSPHSIIMSTLVSVTLQDLMSGLSGATKTVFEEQTIEFIQNELPKIESMGVIFNVNILSVKVMEQTIIPETSKKENSTRRFLQEAGLRVRMEVKGEIFPGDPPDDFDFASLVSLGFAKNYLVWIYRLSSADAFFTQLIGDAPNPFTTDTSGNSKDNQGKGATAGIVVGCVAAVAIAIAAAMYAFRLRDNNNRRFRKPGDITTGSGENFLLAQSDSHSSCMTPYDQANPNFKSPASPNTLENGGKAALGISRKDSEANMFSPADTIHSERFLGIRAPTSPDTDGFCGGIPLCSLFGACQMEEDRMAGDVTPHLPVPTHLAIPHIITKTVSEPIPTSKQMSEPFPISKRMSEPILTMAQPHNTIPSTTKSAPVRNDEASLDEKLSKHVMMASGINTSNPLFASRGSVTNIEYVSDNESLVAAAQNGNYCGSVPDFFDMAKMGGLLGARRMEEDEEVQYKERKSDDAPPQVKRSGLYDVFAPSGALGIVVDTSKDGPVIHSMKASSPLLGLVGSGDLIVGLDGIDTRSMTAATLTRLMAKRAHQSERKLTLLATDI